MSKSYFSPQFLIIVPKAFFLTEKSENRIMTHSRCISRGSASGWFSMGWCVNRLQSGLGYKKDHFLGRTLDFLDFWIKKSAANAGFEPATPFFKGRRLNHSARPIGHLRFLRFPRRFVP